MPRQRLGLAAGLGASAQGTAQQAPLEGQRHSASSRMDGPLPGYPAAMAYDDSQHGKPIGQLVRAVSEARTTGCTATTGACWDAATPGSRAGKLQSKDVCFERKWSFADEPASHGAMPALGVTPSTLPAAASGGLPSTEERNEDVKVLQEAGAEVMPKYFATRPQAA
jgi:hypothetical protein